MNRTPIALAFALVPLLFSMAALGSPSPAPAQEDDSFQPVVSGTDPEQFELVGIGPEAIEIDEQGVVRLSGTPNGYFATKEPFEDYVLRFEWMYERPDGFDDDDAFDGNSGLLLHIEGEHKVWPKCTEAQLAFGDAGHVFAINGAALEAAIAPEQRKEAQAASRLPVGQWNRMEVTCRDGEITCILNDVLIDRGTAASPDSGPFGLQSEGRPIAFRAMMIKPLD